MINFKNLSNATKNEAKHKENLAKERKALITPPHIYRPKRE